MYKFVVNNGNCYGVVLVSRGFNLAQVKISQLNWLATLVGRPLVLSRDARVGLQLAVTQMKQVRWPRHQVRLVLNALKWGVYWDFWWLILQSSCFFSPNQKFKMRFFQGALSPLSCWWHGFAELLTLCAAVSVCRSGCTDSKIRAQTRD